MKRCPTCGMTLDDSLAFCTNDGTPLPSDKPYDPQATLVVPPSGLPTTPPGQGQQTGWQAPARPTISPASYGQQPAYGQQQGQYGQQQAGPRPGKFVPGLVGGLIGGLLSTLADFLPPSPYIIMSFFCVVWAMIGGAAASRLYVKRSETPVRQGEGAVVGLVAGAIAALIYVAIATPVAYAIHGEYIDLVSSMQRDRISAGAFFALTGITGAITIFGFSIVGGIIGVAIFEKRKAYQHVMPPPPPGFGAPPGAYR